MIVCPRCLGKKEVDEYDIQRLKLPSTSQILKGVCEYCNGIGQVDELFARLIPADDKSITYWKYKGGFKNSMYDGFGVLFRFRDEIEYSGHFRNGKKNGKGKYFANGVFYECEWIDDRPIGNVISINEVGHKRYGTLNTIESEEKLVFEFIENNSERFSNNNISPISSKDGAGIR